MSASISQKAYMSISNQLPKNRTTKTISDFLSLLRLGINHSVSSSLESIDWNALRNLADEQGLSAVVLDGIEKLPVQQRPPKLFLLEWIGETLQGYEYRYDMYCKAIAELAGFYNNHGYKMMVLKGYACSLDWPRPEHRPCGDIDIWLFGKQKEADALLASEKELEIDSSHHHHHTVFYWRDFMVENHCDFVNVRDYQSSAGIEKVFKELGDDDTVYVEVYGEKVYLPSPNLHALFLLRHALNHFASVGMSLRQVLDWAFFVEKHTKEIDWKWLNEMLEKFYMKDFCSCINAICVEDLGFDASIFHGVLFSPALKDRVFREILNPEYGNDLPKYLIPRLIFKLKRWWGSAWKRELCFNENGCLSFWKSIWSHILKPKSI